VSARRTPNTPKQTPALKAEAAQFYLRGPIHDSLQALVRGLEMEFGKVLQQAHDIGHQTRMVLAETTLVSREKAAEMLSMSVPQLDRKVVLEEIEVVYTDSRPRFQLIELKRFIEANKKKGRRRWRKK
jgi:hypothetical protein